MGSQEAGLEDQDHNENEVEDKDLDNQRVVVLLQTYRHRKWDEQAQ